MRQGGTATMGAVVIGVLLALACGCGGRDVAIDAGAPPSVPATSGIAQWNMATQVPESWTLQPANVKGIRSSDRAGTLLVEVQLEPVRLSDASCAADAGGWIEDEGNPDVVWASLRAAVPNVSRDDALLLPAR